MSMHEKEATVGKSKAAKKMHNKILGMRGEDAVSRYLELQGYEVLERNWSCPAGEADIIALDGITLVFVEVKTRWGVGKGFPSDAVDAKKKARYEKIAGWYLRQCEFNDIPVRFDVAAVLVLSEDRGYIRHYVNAFQPDC